jgi:4-hydroxybenzoate polyprenyltransferase
VARHVHRLADAIRETAEMIVLKHSVFALPFAVIAAATAAEPGWLAPRVWAWGLVAMIAARTAAMTFNRLADHELDAANPRTAGRALPAGRVSRRFAWAVTAGASLLFVVAAGRLNRLCLALAVPALAVLLAYSYAKRFTAAAHLWLGASLGLAPPAAWIAVTGSIASPPLVLGAAVALWVAGFDIIYSLQDESFDRARGLHSAPARLGGRRALLLARLLHAAALAGFAAFAVMAGGGWLRLTAVAAAGLLLVRQHRLVSPGDLRAVDAAFFTANGVLSVLMCLLFLFAKMRPDL